MEAKDKFLWLFSSFTPSTKVCLLAQTFKEVENLQYFPHIKVKKRENKKSISVKNNVITRLLKH